MLNHMVKKGMAGIFLDWNSRLIRDKNIVLERLRTGKHLVIKGLRFQRLSRLETLSVSSTTSMVSRSITCSLSWMLTPPNHQNLTGVLPSPKTRKGAAARLSGTCPQLISTSMSSASRMIKWDGTTYRSAIRLSVILSVPQNLSAERPASVWWPSKRWLTHWVIT